MQIALTKFVELMKDKPVAKDLNAMTTEWAKS